MAVIVLLAHESKSRTRSASGGAAVLEGELRAKAGLAKLQLLMYEELSLTQLGQGTDIPLLRARFRSQDRPGILANAIDWIGHAMSNESPPIDPIAWGVPYALIQVVSGRLALGHFTIRLADNVEQVKGWDTDKITEIERKIANLAAAAARTGSELNPSEDEQQEAQRPLISMGLIEKPRTKRSIQL
jgi:hypothetical protein